MGESNGTFYAEYVSRSSLSKLLSSTF